jgi:hypothetical protein
MHKYKYNVARCVCGLTVLGGAALQAEQWEIGAAGGYRFARSVSLTRGTASADAGFGNGGTFSVYGGQQWIGRLGGELRYTYSDADPRVTSSGNEVKSSGYSHSVHYDALVYVTGQESRVKPFIAFGGGIRYFEGTARGTELGVDRLAILARASELKPMASVGGGLKCRLAGHVSLRIDFRDYITPFPRKLVVPAAGGSLRGWLHDVTPMVGISAVF